MHAPVLATALEALRYRWIPLFVIYVAIVGFVVARYARPFIEERREEVREGEPASAAWYSFVALMAVGIGGGVVALFLSFIFYGVLWVLDKAGI